MTETWTLADLVAEAKTRLEALPPPKNGQVRAVPDDRTVRYYASLGMLDRPAAMRGRTALYGPRHLAQIVAIKRMQSAGHSLAEIQRLWPTLDDVTLMRVSGVELPVAAAAMAKGKGREFWKSELPDAARVPDTRGTRGAAPDTRGAAPDTRGAAPDTRGDHDVLSARGVEAAVRERTHVPTRTSSSSKGEELRIDLVPGVAITIALPDGAAISISSADIRALRAAAASLVTELADRGLITRAPGTLEEKP